MLDVGILGVRVISFYGVNGLCGSCIMGPSLCFSFPIGSSVFLLCFSFAFRPSGLSVSAGLLTFTSLAAVSAGRSAGQAS